MNGDTYLGVVLSVTGMESNSLEVEAGRQIDSGDNVLKRWDDTRVASIHFRGCSRSSDTVGIAGLLHILLRGGRGQLGAVRIRERSRSHELREC